jgi:RPA family protein
MYTRITPEEINKLDQSNIEHVKKGDKNISMLKLKTGELAKRFVIAGTITSVTKLGQDFYRAKISTPAGNVYVTAGSYNPESLELMKEIEKNFEPTCVMAFIRFNPSPAKNSSKIYISLGAEKMFVVEPHEIDNWMKDTITKTDSRTEKSELGIDMVPHMRKSAAEFGVI